MRLLYRYSYIYIYIYIANKHTRKYTVSCFLVKWKESFKILLIVDVFGVATTFTSWMVLVVQKQVEISPIPMVWEDIASMGDTSGMRISSTSTMELVGCAWLMQERIPMVHSSTSPLW